MLRGFYIEFRELQRVAPSFPRAEECGGDGGGLGSIIVAHKADGAIFALKEKVEVTGGKPRRILDKPEARDLSRFMKLTHEME